MRPGDTPSGVFYLKKGFARLYSISKDGQELSMIIFKPGDVFPFIWAITDTQNLYYLEAMTTVELYRAPKALFINLIKNNSDILYTLTGRILVRFGGLLERMEYLVFGSAYQKIASIIHLCADRFGERRGSNIFLQVPLTHKDIAALVGITRETASIEIKKLERGKIISYRGRFLVVKNIKKLNEESLLSNPF